MTIRPSRLRFLAAAATLALAAAPALAQTKKELVQRFLQIQQSEIEAVAKSVVERPVYQMMQEVGLVMRQMPADKREAIAKQIDAEARKYVDEAYPLARERAVKIAPQTIGAALEEKLSLDELKQLVTWLESPAAKKFQAMGPDMRNAFIQKLLTESQPVVDPKLQALDARIRVVMGLPPAASAAAASGGPLPKAAAPARPASK